MQHKNWSTVVFPLHIQSQEENKTYITMRLLTCHLYNSVDVLSLHFCSSLTISLCFIGKLVLGNKSVSDHDFLPSARVVFVRYVEGSKLSLEL
jgi:hypothetical protein